MALELFFLNEQKRAGRGKGRRPERKKIHHPFHDIFLLEMAEGDVTASRLRMRWRQKRAATLGQSAWPDLPPELLDRIIGVLDPVDHIAVRLVCASWRACVRESFPSDIPFEVPRLLIRRPGHGGDLAFFSLRRRKILPFSLPARFGAGRCCGHVRGWLAMAFDSERSLVLCNPVSGQFVAVPHPPVFPVKKLVLSGPPTSHGRWVAAALGRAGTMIALLQPAVSAACWTTIGVKEGEQHRGFRDMAFWRGGLCALGHDGAVLAFRADLGARAAAVSLLRDAVPRTSSRFRCEQYLVEAEGELMVVRKLYSSLRHGGVDLEVEVRVLVAPEKRRWDLLAETPGQALFVGSVVSVAVPVVLHNSSSPGQLRESCVYFARREVEMLAPHAICEYSLIDEQMKGVPVAGGHNVLVEPVWITPFV